MRLFLASYRFGLARDRFLQLTGPPGRIAVIADAADSWPDAARASAVTSEFTLLRSAGFLPVEVDLRELTPSTAHDVLAAFPAVWVRGGNTFVLRRRMASSGADEAIARLLAEDSIVYGGYSAGACVMGPTLRGVEYADPPGEVEPTTGEGVLWTGLGIIDDVLVPHWASDTLDPDGASAAMAAACDAAGTPYRTLTDEQVYVVDGGDPTVI
ncbi:Type 1 glutamine amidotransferase-like domain-containing protein [Rhodococcus sp. BP-349]|uniref:Type 1 glutamine amidotransferase-like domain-containing protein n=1 Tax=unclassified Rhodococcus (in: high G+C Gram-positive bacteria) TaxID=192944 RepID=UPI001C9A34D5|nr:MULTISPECIES: Type 1 glutamine amidotransferase-like domain-containing protein [unclassified Rhodococcus (in: high G+C Gram-positive bacteria)]MBY6540188.1 Type 1 glutamine amidotransferase-like domain-containing protein [Rhodococcus sp. BP-363]MBY6543484.1 Type 1 glutamine amidotransferase-like domain-containing protein [Rhodococcus sp. BP-369]MBY6562714.1 Type 1 glutamine amidotransferase-like domain-containing protein [Rhodococcus sp. BP-370]MBY6577006.1 Type 1 glutamine amidotransferase-